MKLFRVSQKAFVRNREGRVLLVRFSQQLHDAQLRGLWDIPGGGVEFGEDLDVAFHREVTEEIGVMVEKGRFITIWDWIMRSTPTSEETYKSPDSNDHHCVVLAYDATFKVGSISLNEEHDEFVWMDPHDWRQYDMGLKKDIERIWTDYLSWYSKHILKRIQR